MVSLALAMALTAGLAYGWGQDPSNGLLDVTKPPQTPQTSPGSSLSPEQRGDIFMARKMYREALEAFAKGSQNDPVILNKTGIAYHQLQQLDRARKHYERALKLRPSYAEAQNNIGTTYAQQKSYRRAINAYKKAIKLNPNSSSFHLNLAIAYFSRKNEKLFLEELHAALALDPEVFERRGNYGVVIEERTTEERAKFHYSMAKVYALASRNELALQHLRKALEEGFRDKKKMQNDAEFELLRELPEFKELLALEPRVL